MLTKLLKNYQNRFLSSWIVLLIDLLIVALSLFIAYLLRYNFKLPFSELEALPTKILFIVGVSGFSFFYSKSHVGIIRHTNSADVVRLLYSLIFTVIVLIVVNFIRREFGIFKIIYIPLSIILIYILAAGSLLLLFRLFIKLSYHNLKLSKENQKNILIYGAGVAGLMAKNAVLNTNDSLVKVIGFIDSNPQKIGKTIEGIKIYAPSVLTKEFLAKNEVNELVFAIRNIDSDKKKEIIEDIIDKFELEIKDVPPVESWINGELSAVQINKISIENLLQRSPIKLNNKHVIEHIRGKVVMITGAAGSIGSELSRQICFYDPKFVVFVDQSESPLYDLQQELIIKHPNLIDRFDFQIANIRNEETMKRIFCLFKPELVYHSAAYKHVPLMEYNPFSSVNTNIFGTKIIADLSIAHNVEKFVMVSTDKAVNPTNVMGACKRVAEIYCQSLNNKKDNTTKFITTRFGNVLGSNGSVVPLFRKQIESGGPLTITHPEITRYFMTIPEACQLVFEAGAMGNGGEIYLFDMGKAVKIKDLAYKMIKLYGLKPEKDISIVYTGLRAGEKLYEELLNNEEYSVATHHKKITIAKVREYNIDDVNNMLEQLKSAYNTYDKMKLVAQIKKIVPEYKSKNSIFEELD